MEKDNNKMETPVLQTASDAFLFCLHHSIFDMALPFMVPNLLEGNLHKEPEIYKYLCRSRHRLDYTINQRAERAALHSLHLGQCGSWGVGVVSSHP